MTKIAQEQQRVAAINRLKRIGGGYVYSKSQNNECKEEKCKNQRQNGSSRCEKHVAGL